jgi:hypothetical protein
MVTALQQPRRKGELCVRRENRAILCVSEAANNRASQLRISLASQLSSRFSLMKTHL